MSQSCFLMLHQSQTSRVESNQQGENIGHRSRAHNPSEAICPACVLQSCLPTFTRSSLSSAKHLSQSMRPITTGSRRLCCLLPCRLWHSVSSSPSEVTAAESSHSAANIITQDPKRLRSGPLRCKHTPPSKGRSTTSVCTCVCVCVETRRRLHTVYT